MKVKFWFARRRYLVKTAATCIVFLLIPCMVALSLFLSVARSQLENANAEYYRNATAMFRAYFQEELYDMRRLANQIGLDSRENGKTAYALSLIEPGVNEYYYWDALRALALLGTSSKYSIGVYYPETDALLYGKNKYTVEAMWDQIFEGRIALDDFRAFLNGTENSVVRYVSDGRTLFVGMAVPLGASRSDSLIFYTLKSGDLALKQFAVAGAYDAQYSLFSSDSQLLLSSAGENAVVLEDVANGARIRKLDSGGRGQTAFLLESGGLYYASVVPLDAMEESLYAFYSSMQLALLLASCGVVLLGVAMIYVNYRPIRRIADHFFVDGSVTDELGGIMRYVERVQSEMNERNLALLDLLLGNLLSGAPIPARELERAGLPEKGWFCVSRIQGASLLAADRIALSGLVNERFGAKIYITDIVERNETVLIALLPSREADTFAGVMRDWIRTNVSHDAAVRTGAVVSSVNDIRRSYEDCAGEPAAERKNAGGDVSALCDGILAFIENNFANPELCQVMVADRFGISTYSLSRLFKNHVGVGFSEFVNSKRVEAAKALLDGSGKSVAEIAAAVGIANPNYFSRLFKAVVGQTPMRYRENCRNARSGS